MKTILLTIDTEFYISKEEILGINGENGIDDILQILDQYHIKATFFIDYFAVKKWGADIFHIVNEKIAAKGHDIQLHIHPHIIGGKSYLWQYDKQEQEKLIDEAISYFEKFNGSKPSFFRAGGYSANDETLAILANKEFKADSSFQYRQKRCKISKNLFPYINKISTVTKIVEIPVTVYKYYYPFKRYNSVNIEWCSLFELKEILQQVKKSPLDTIVVMMHSFGLQKRKDRKKISKSFYRKYKFKQFLKYASENNFNFSTVDTFYQSYNDLEQNDTKDFIPILKNPLTVMTGLFTRFLNFWTINKKFRQKSVIIGSVLFLILFLVFYSLFFNYIEPSVHKYQNVEPDVYSWNKDNDIHTIEYFFIYNKEYQVDITNRLDPEGIIFSPHFGDTRKYRIKPGVDTLYIPTVMSGTIINFYNMYQQSPEQYYIDQIMLYAHWLKDHAIISDSIAIWTHPYKFTKYDIDYDWTGAWAMGNILSALARYYQISADPQFMQLGKKAVKAFSTKIEDGGILAIDQNFDYWYEEYPTIPKSSVLNGHINGILGLYDFWRVTQYPLAFELATKGIFTVKNNLDKYDSGYWSYYDLEYSYVTDYYYHKIVHIAQLSILYQISGDKIFKEYEQKWRNYLNEPYYSIFKLKILIDAIHRRFTYKSLFTWGK